MISIIVPVYNAEKWIKKCVDSIINQTYKDIEILLINDGSKDRSIDILKEYEKKDSRIRVFDKQNEGVSKTRNLGIKEAKGEYIQFVDCDDYIEENMCEKMLNLIEDFDMAICGMRIWQNGVILREPHPDTKIYTLSSGIDIYFELRKINLGPCNKLYRKEKITSYFKEDISLGEDTLFVLDYMKNVEKVSSTSECFYNVSLDNENSLNRSSKVGKFELLLNQRIHEEEFLIEKYGKKADFSKMYEQYLLNLHAYFFDISIKNNKELKKFIKKYAGHPLLTEKIKNSTPVRPDYKLFRFLFLNKLTLFIYLFFNLKKLFLK